MEVPAEIIENVARYLASRAGRPCPVRGGRRVAGGCIHQTFRLDTDSGPFFLKWNDAGQADNFLAERRGLELLARHSGDFTAIPLATGRDARHSFLLLEFIEQGKPLQSFWQDFGRRLAALHRHTSSFFGLDHHNFIGSLPQSNRQHPDFITFFIEERLLPQVRRAQQAGLLDAGTGQSFDRLYPRLPDLLPTEVPALLHGDLWQGNVLCGKDQRPYLIDPAVFYGHREAEVAFTALFGGFAAEFYSAYEESFPLATGWQKRTGIFNLYPLLVHLNIFGRAYLNEITGILRAFR